METRGLELDLGNVAWAPVNDFGSLELLDRFNGIPTLGVFSSGTSWFMFWRTFHVGDASIWLYVPLEDAECDAMLDECELDGVLFNRTAQSFATVGAAYENRLVFEREIRLTAHQDNEQTWQAVIAHAVKSLELALKHGLPPARREQVRRVQEELQSV